MEDDDISVETNLINLGKKDPSPKKKLKRKKPIFERPPFASELFTEEMKDVFDKHPGYSRYFIKEYLLTGNLKLAAKKANLQSSVDLSSAETKSIVKMLDDHKMSSEDLMLHLSECLNAESILRDKHGNLHKAVDLKIKLQTIELILRLRGELSKNPRKENNSQALIDMFSSLSPEAD